MTSDHFRKIILASLIFLTVSTAIIILVTLKKDQARKVTEETIGNKSDLSLINVNKGQITLESQRAEEPVVRGQDLSLDARMDSQGEDIVGYDVIVSYDATAFDFVRAESAQIDFAIFTNKKTGFVIITGTKNLNSKEGAVFTDLSAFKLQFKSKKKGIYKFTVNTSIDPEETKLVNSKTQVLKPSVDSLEVEVE